MPTTAYPDALDTAATLPTKRPRQAIPSVETNTQSAAIKAIEAKIGIGSSAPTQGQALSATDDGESYWHDKPMVDIYDFGARGGSNDDTAAIRAAIDKVRASGGTVLYSLLARTSDSILGPSNVRHLGVGWGSGIKALASFAGADAGKQLLMNESYTASVITDTNIAVENMVLDYGPLAASGAYHALEFRRVRHVRVTQVLFNCARSGDAVAGLGVDDMIVRDSAAYEWNNCAWDFWTSSTNVKVINCYAETSGANQLANFNPETSAGAGSGGLAQGLIFNGNTCVYTGGGSALSLIFSNLGAGGLVKDVTVQENHFYNCQVTIRGATSRAHVKHNTFVGVITRSAIYSYTLLDPGDGVTPIGTPDAVEATGNVIYGETVSLGNLGILRIEGTNSDVSHNLSVGGANTVGLVYSNTATPVQVGNSSDLDTALRGRVINRFQILAPTTITTHDDLTVTNTGSNGANLVLSGNTGSGNANKTLRAFSGQFQILNSAYTSVLFLLTDSGNAIASALTGRAAGGSATGTFQAFSADATGTVVQLEKSRNATVGSHTVVQTSDFLGSIIWYGSDGSAYQNGARIMAQVTDASPSATAMGTDLIFYTAATSSVTLTERMRIKAAGTMQMNAVAITSASQLAARAAGGSIVLQGSAYSADALGPQLQFTKSRNASLGSSTVVNNSDVLGVISFHGADGTTYQQSAVIKALVADPSPSSSAMGGQIQILTSPAGTVSPTLKMTITAAQVAFADVVVSQASQYAQRSAGGLIGLATQAYSADASGPIQQFSKSRNASLGSHTVVQTNDILGTSVWYGSDGSAYQLGAKVIVQVTEGTPSSTAMGSAMIFYTSPAGTVVPTEKLRITAAGVLLVAEAGNVSVGTTTGTKIGTATTQKIGFWNATPVVQQADVGTNDGTLASVATQANAIRTLLRAIGLMA